ncbi:MAG: type II toxin-antitoxin system VapC family toxin [Nanoarchaeota archaeon]
MILIFDTSILIELERGNSEIIKKISELRKVYPAPARISFISYFEFLYGLRKRSEKNRDKSIKFVERFDIIQTSKETAEILVNLKQNYELPLSDLLIASHVREIKGILVTKDNDFKEIKEINKVIL